MNRLRIVRPCALALAITVALVAPAMAADGADVERRLQALESNWVQVQQELARMHRELDELNARAAPAPAALSSNVAQRLGAVESYAQSLQDELKTVKSSVAAHDDAITASSQAQSRSLAISAYGNFIAGKRSGTNSALDAESFEFVLSGQPHPRIGFFSELEFERAASVGAERGGEVLLEQAYVDLTLTDAITLRSGVLLMPFGNVGADHYAPLRDTISKTLSSYAIAPSDWTDNGFGLVGDLALNDEWHLAYETYLVAGLNADIRTEGFRDARQGFGVDNNNNKALVSHVSFNRLDTLELGLASYNGAYDDHGKQGLSGLGFNFSWTLAPLKFTGDLLRLRAERDNASTVSYWGGYLRGSYDVSSLLPAHWRGELFPDAHLALIYQYDYIDVGDINGVVVDGSREWRHTLGFKFEPARSWIFKFNYERSQYAGRPILNGNDDAWLIAIGYVF